MSVRENVRCGVLWSMGHGYSFWRNVGRLDDVQRKTAEILDRVGLIDKANLPAALLPYADQRTLEIAITIAGGADVILLDEPTAGMSHSETERAVELIGKATRGQDAADRGARHGRGLRPRRPDLGAGLRRDHRHRHARGDPRRSRVREAYLGDEAAELEAM